MIKFLINEVHFIISLECMSIRSEGLVARGIYQSYLGYHNKRLHWDIQYQPTYVLIWAQNLQLNIYYESYSCQITLRYIKCICLNIRKSQIYTNITVRRFTVKGDNLMLMDSIPKSSRVQQTSLEKNRCLLSLTTSSGIKVRRDLFFFSFSSCFVLSSLPPFPFFKTKSRYP